MKVVWKRLYGLHIWTWNDQWCTLKVTGTFLSGFRPDFAGSPHEFFLLYSWMKLRPSWKELEFHPCVWYGDTGTFLGRLLSRRPWHRQSFSQGNGRWCPAQNLKTLGPAWALPAVVGVREPERTWKVVSPSTPWQRLLFAFHQDRSGSGSERNTCTFRTPISSDPPSGLLVDMCSPIWDSWTRPDEPVGHSGSQGAQDQLLIPWIWEENQKRSSSEMETDKERQIAPEKSLK